MEATTGTTTTAATSSMVPSDIQTARLLQKRTFRTLWRTSKPKKSKRRPLCSACSSKWAFCSTASSSVGPPALRILPQLTSVSPQAWHSVSLADNPLLFYSLRSFSTVRTPFSRGLASLGRHFFLPTLWRIANSIAVLVFGQRGDLGGESRYQLTRISSPSQFVRPWVRHSLLTISLQKRSRALGLVHVLPYSSFRGNRSFVEYGSLAR